MKFDLSVEHTIQKQIIQKLSYANRLRFSELKPDRIESNLFMYHLKQLMKLGFVQKVDNSYTLTAVGLAHVDKLSMKDFKHRVQAKIITILAIEHEDGSWLMLRRLHQPYIGKIGFPSGKVHYGESIQAAAERDLIEKAGLSGLDLTYRGSCNFIFDNNGEIVSNILGQIFYAKTDHEKIEKVSEGCETYWTDMPTKETDEYIPGYLDIHKALKENKSQFFLEKTYDISKLLQS